MLVVSLSVDDNKQIDLLKLGLSVKILELLACVNFSPQIEQLQATLQDVSAQKSQLEDDLQRNMEMVRGT